MTILAVAPRMLYLARSKPPLLIHLLTSPPKLASQQQRTSVDWPAVTSTTRIHRLIWFGWSQVRLVDARW